MIKQHAMWQLEGLVRESAQVRPVIRWNLSQLSTAAALKEGCLWCLQQPTTFTCASSV